jgi:hypothetical protein
VISIRDSFDLSRAAALLALSLTYQTDMPKSRPATEKEREGCSSMREFWQRHSGKLTVDTSELRESRTFRLSNGDRSGGRKERRSRKEREEGDEHGALRGKKKEGRLGGVCNRAELTKQGSVRAG